MSETSKAGLDDGGRTAGVELGNGVVGSTTPGKCTAAGWRWSWSGAMHVVSAGDGAMLVVSTVGALAQHRDTFMVKRERRTHL
jgi:hypothetical protein